MQGDTAWIELAKRRFRHFLPFVKVDQPGIGMVPLQMWPHVVEVVDALENYRLIDIAKARQIGITTILSAYALWHAMFTPRGLVLVFSKGEIDAWKFLQKSRGTYEMLPEPLQVPLGGINNREYMSFAHGGTIEAFPSTEGAGRGVNPTLVLMDEADRHEYLEAAFNSVKPGLDDQQGQLVLFSTVNPYKLGGLFQEIYQNAPANGFHKMFFGWKVRPNRTDEWYKQEEMTYQDKALFEKEFPATEEEAFAPARALAAFDLDVLAKMKQDVKDPLEVLTLGNGVRANIFQEFQPGKRYSAATDTSHGTGHDYAVTAILDTTTGYVVADIYSSVLNPSELAVASVELLNRYDSPIWAIEDNDWGAVTIQVAQTLHYRRLYYYAEGKCGWHTFDTGGLAHPENSRYVIWGDLIEAVNRRALTIPNGQGLAQFFTVIRNPEKRGRIEAQQGAHDDYPMALAIAWQIRSQARPAAGDRGREGQPDGILRRVRQGWSRW